MNEDPRFAFNQTLMSMWMPQALHAAAELGLADALAEGPLNSDAIADAIGAHRAATGRLCAALCAIDFLARDGSAYALTARGRLLQSGNPGSLRSVARLMGGPTVWEAWGKLAECVRTGRPSYVAGQTDSRAVFDALDGDTRQADIFHRAMAEWTRGVAPALAEAMDVAEAEHVVDVGGGWGELLVATLAVAKRARGTIYDRANAERGAKAYLTERGVETRAQFLAGDLLEAPPPRGDVLLLKSVIHDWDDAWSRRILSSCARSLGPRERLLVIEPPFPETRGTSPFEAMLSFSDLNMLVNTGGLERTERAYVALIEASGLRVRRVIPTAGPFRIFESVAR